MSEDTSIVAISNVHAYLDKDGTAWINAEDVARGLGFVKTEEKFSTTCGRNEKYESVRWARVNQYLSEFGYPKTVGSNDYIPENMFYRLAMKANNEAAINFQAKIADEVLPAIRKTGAYSVRTLSPQDQLFKFMDKLGSVNDPGAQLALIDMFRATIPNTQPNLADPDTITVGNLFQQYIVPVKEIKVIPVGDGVKRHSVTALYNYILKNFHDSIVSFCNYQTGVGRDKALILRNGIEEIIQALIADNLDPNARL